MPASITPLVPMDIFTGEPVKIDLVYAEPEHPENIFGTALYHTKARLSLHKDLARIVLRCARTLHNDHGWTLVLKDGLRPVECQQHMMETSIVKANPQWLEGPSRLLSPPGMGAHPRGMAIDVSLIRQDGSPVEMGTSFDEMSVQSARNYRDFSPIILQNRQTLEEHFINAAQSLNLPLLPLPSEWWDFRFPSTFYGQRPAFREADLPAPLQMIMPEQPSPEWEEHFITLAKDVLLSI